MPQLRISHATIKTRCSQIIFFLMMRQLLHLDLLHPAYPTLHRFGLLYYYHH